MDSAVLPCDGFQMLCVTQDAELVDTSAGLPFLLLIKSHPHLLSNPGPRWKRDVLPTLMKFDRAEAHQRVGASTSRGS